MSAQFGDPVRTETLDGLIVDVRNEAQRLMAATLRLRDERDAERKRNAALTNGMLASADVFEAIIRNAGDTLDTKSRNALQCAATRLRTEAARG